MAQQQDNTDNTNQTEQEDIMIIKKGYKFYNPKVGDTDPKAKKTIVTGTGRRKTAVSTVFLYQEKGEFIINGKSSLDYFPSETEQIEFKKPFHAIGVSHPEAQFSATIKVFGSGTSAQLGAVVHGISRALAQIDEEWRVSLRKAGLLTRDDRMVERKKPYLRKARKKKQYSKR